MRIGLDTACMARLVVIEHRSTRLEYPTASVEQLDLLLLIFGLWHVIVEPVIASHIVELVFLMLLRGDVERRRCDDNVDAVVRNLPEATAGLVIEVIQLHDDSVRVSDVIVDIVDAFPFCPGLRPRPIGEPGE